MKKLLYIIFLALVLKFVYMTYSTEEYPKHIVLSDGSHFWLGWRIETPPTLTYYPITNLTKFNGQPYAAHTELSNQDYVAHYIKNLKKRIRQ